MVRDERSEVTTRSGVKGMALVVAASAALAAAGWLLALVMSVFLA